MWHARVNTKLRNNLTPSVLIDAYMRHTFKCTGCGLTYINASVITFRVPSLFATKFSTNVLQWFGDTQ